VDRARTGTDRHRPVDHLVYLLSFLALWLAVRRDARLAPMQSLRAWRAHRQTLRRLLVLGVPISATYGSEAGFFSVVALLVGSFGAAALAAHTAVNQLIYLVFQITVGLSHAASISVSREVARGRIPAASRISRTALLHGFAVMTVMGALYLAVPEVMLRPFLDPGDPGEQAAIALATHLLVVAAMLQYFDCTQNIGIGLLRGLDDTAGGFRLTVVGYWVVGLPAAWLLGHVAGQGPTGIWLGLATGLAVTACLLLRRFARGLGRLRPETVPATAALP
jgi:MATE family multidrug resistance protein